MPDDRWAALSTDELRQIAEVFTESEPALAESKLELLASVREELTEREKGE